MRTTLLAALVGFGCCTQIALAQGTQADYDRAAGLRGRFQGKVFKSSVQPNWFAEGTRFWYRNDLPGERREFVAVDAAAGKREPAFDHARVAAALTEKLGKEVAADKLPIEGIEFMDGNAAVRFPAEGKYWKFTLADGTLAETERFELPRRRQDGPGAGRGGRGGRGGSGRGGFGRGGPSGRSPDGKWTVSVRDFNLMLKANDGGQETPLTTDGTSDHFYEDRIRWSPDSSRLVALKTRAAERHPVYLIESSPRDQLQPKLHTIEQYLKPGDRIAQSKPHLFLVEGQKHVPIKDDLFANPWSVEQIRWAADSSRFTFVYNQRGHQVLRVVAVAGDTGEAGTIVEETSPTFVDYSSKQFIHWADATGEIIWSSERDGWNHLYLYDGRTGEVKNQITRGSWLVRSVERVDETARQIWFRAGGIYPEQDPYHLHACRVNFDGTGLVILTAGNGTHEIDYSPDRRYVLDTWSRVDQPPVSELRKALDGSLVARLEEADWSGLVAADWKAPERFVAKGRDGTTDIFGVIFRPTNFDSQKKYPVIEQIYAGPQGAFVPKRFSSYYGPQALAELGFIVVQIDGMGTNWRSKAFHDVCWKNLGDSGFPDRIAWLKKAAEAYPQMDLTRVGIYGGSAGGQSSTRAMLAHGDFYKVAVSDCGCHDNRMDKIWWNEQWMGWPVGPHYAEQSNVTQAKNLTGKLLLIVGELDRNVDPASTMQVVNALIQANKDFDFLLVPGAGHGAAGSAYGQRRQRDFFVRHLLGVEPRSQ
jgi:dipeptidyl aminopeptidase/acylaminoacyl peptidase